MPLFRRSPRVVPLPFPRLDGTTWPDRRTAGASFAASTLYSLAGAEAFTAEAHDVADVVLDEVLPLLDTGAAPEDAAHMRQVCSAAAQVGAGIGLVEARSQDPGPDRTDREVAAVLWLAADDLPPMPPQQRDVARYLLQCGYYLARTDRSRVFDVTGALWEEEHPAVRPGHDPGDSH
jgi:hypothetical protein